MALTIYNTHDCVTWSLALLAEHSTRDLDAKLDKNIRKTDIKSKDDSTFFLFAR